MRVFAGPNGSGKSTIIKEIEKIVSTRPYINADDIERTCREKKFINLSDYYIETDNKTFSDFINSSTLYKKALQDGYNIDLTFSDNIIKTSDTTHSYEAAIISAFIRNLLIDNGISFSFETVMSHPSKLDLFRKAKEKGFVNYLYFIATEDVEINIARVAGRVILGGHPVHPDKIKERYERTLALLPQMIQYCHRCFIFDNSFEEYRLIAEIVDGKEIIGHYDDIPAWVNKYVIHKLTDDLSQ